MEIQGSARAASQHTMHQYQSNRLENLFRQLLFNCTSRPLADPFAAEVIVVQHPGMGQWISRQWALTTGIASLFSFPLPARALGELYQQLLDAPRQEDPWQSAVLRWRILALLPAYSGHPAFAPLSAYLQPDADEESLLQLAGRIAAVFDQYLVYRPDVLLQWEAAPQGSGSESGRDWQAIVWRRLAEGRPPHRAHQQADFLRLSAHRPVPQVPAAKTLPQRLHLFGISSLAPVYLELFVQLSRHIETHFYQLSPCSQYWFDLAPARHQAEAQAQDSLLAFSTPMHSADHPLLVQLGQAGRDFGRQLLASGLDDAQDLYEEPQGNSLLAELQRQVLYLSPVPEPEERAMIAPDDRSLELHCCFSPLREVQVLHDYLLDGFERDPQLRPGDILVAAPEISRYSAAVQAVFGEAPRERFIPWSLADQPLAGRDALAPLFLSLLGLFESRCTSIELLILLEHPAMHRRFDLDASQLPLAHNLVQIAGIRWGLDAAHRRDLGIAAGPVHSWRHGLDRLLLGYAMGSTDALHEGLLPCAPGGEEAKAVLASLLQFYDTLDGWRRRWQSPRPAREWPPLLLHLVADCLRPSSEEELDPVRTGIQALAEELELARFDGLLSPQALRLVLEEKLNQADSGQAFLSGRVTFCNMVPMRSLPFQIICFLGMNDGDFPRLQHPVSFDQMARHPRLGDRNRRDDDRYLFLEAILSARSQLFLSWVGRSRRDGTERPPSVVVSELLDYLDSSMQVAGHEETQMTPISSRLLQMHPLQPFSAENYTGRSRTAGFNPSWLPAASLGPSPPFLAEPLPLAAGTASEVELGALLRFWRNPARSFLRGHLGMGLQAGEVLVEEAEPFSLDGLERYGLRQDIIRRSLAGQEEARISAVLGGQGGLPMGSFAGLALAGPMAEATALAETLRPFVLQPFDPLEVQVTLADTLLRGWLDRLHQSGRIVWAASGARANLLLETWLCHLVLAAIPPENRQNIPCASHLFSWDGKAQAVRHCMFAELDAELARQHLRPYVEGFLQGQEGLALPFFPNSALAWAEQMHKSGDMEKAHKAACTVWQGGYTIRGEREDPAFLKLFPQEDPCDEDFIELAELLLTMLEMLVLAEVGDAAA
ncbi:MAG: exodeoxyribonuclease V subunit gamma [bacterium]|nr:exodeoxyribonuclease V subunit gamma [bacterium]